MKGLFNALNMNIGMFTIIPPFKKVWDEKSGKHMMKMYPIIGLIIGVIWYAISILLIKIGAKGMILSALMLGIPFFLTGFIHLDGFMDVSDAILSRRDKETKLRILKDSTVGAFSVISLVLLLIVEYGSITEIVLDGKKLVLLILIPVISRSIAGYFLITEESIKESYFGKLFKEGTGVLDKIILILFFILSCIVFILEGKLFVLIPIGMVLLSFYLLWNCKKNLGGINGDVAGYVLVLSEMIALIIFAIV
ncbi:MAG: adenosylcobinamide-GDP ribazoletransferase [Clostridium sp.]